VGLAYAYSELSREQDARAEAAEVMRLSPHFSLEKVKQRQPVNQNDPSNQHFLAELRKAGLK
jgi:adenylate cyclase